MAILAVEIDQVGEDETAIRQVCHGVDRSRQARVVAMRLDLLTRAAMSEDVADLADRDDRPAGLRQHIEDRVARRLSGKILAVAGSRETCLAPSRRKGGR